MKLNIMVDRVTFFTGLKLFPGRSPTRDICAVMVSLARGGSVRLRKHRCSVAKAYDIKRPPGCKKLAQVLVHVCAAEGVIQRLTTLLHSTHVCMHPVASKDMRSIG